MKKDTGIYYQNGLYIAKVFYKTKEYYVGCFKNKEDAIRAREEEIPKIRAGISTCKARKNYVIQSDDFEPDDSFYDDPEYKLRYAVLMSAMRDLSHAKTTKEYIETKEWIMSDSDDYYSFTQLCELFRLNPTAVREKILNLDEKTKEKIRHTSY